MNDTPTRWRRPLPVALLALTTAAGLAAVPAAADPVGPSAAGTPAAVTSAAGTSGIKGAPAAPAPTVSDAGCTLTPSLTVKGESASCLGVGAKLSATPTLGASVTLTVTVKAGRVEKATAVSVDLPSTFAFAQPTTTTAAHTGAGPVTRAVIATVDLAAGETRTFTRVVKAVAPGSAEIAARATSVTGAGRTDAGADYVHLTVGDAAARTASSAGIAAPAGDQATAATSAPAAAPVVDRASVPLPSAASPTAQKAAVPATAGTSCATGNWYYVDQAGVTRGVYDTVVQVWRSGSIVASGFADSLGHYTLCWASGGTTNAVYVRFLENNGAWKLVTLAGGDFAFVSGTVDVADGTTVNFGGLQPADATNNMRGLHAYADAAYMYDWIYQNAAYIGGCWSPYSATCRQLVIHWQSDSTTGTYWNSSGAYLLAASPDSEDEPVHEFGHELMYDLYGSTFPATTNCSPHYLLGVSSSTCGWTEGWADWVPTAVWGNTVYTFASGSTVEFNRTWNDGYDTGDQVEGRIVQALDSLNDGVKYPFDNISGPGYRTAAPYFTVLRFYRPNTLAAFWSGRGADGQDVGQASLSALYQATIDYGFRNPLTDGVARSFPEAVPPHNYSFTTTRNYWSAVAVRPSDGTDVDLSLYDDAAQTEYLNGSGYGGNAVDFVAVNSNAGARALQTYYPRLTQYSGTGGYVVQAQQGSTTFSTGTFTTALASNQVIANWDSYQSTGVPVYYRAVPASTSQSVALTFLQPGGTTAARGTSPNSPTGTGGEAVSLAATPSATGWGGLVLVNQGLTAGNVTLYADTTAPTGSVVVNGGAASTADPTVSLAISASDAETGVVSMQISADGVFDTEAVVPYATTNVRTLSGPNADRTVSVRFLNNAGMWSAPVTDSITVAVPPSITSVSPASGPTTGAQTVTIVGARFTGATSVKFGTANASFTVVNDGKITVNTPSAPAGTVNVRVTTAAGQSATSNAAKYIFSATPAIISLTPASGPVGGGTSVTIVGSGFSGATRVQFGNVDATSVTVLTATKIRAVAPAGAPGTVNVRVSGPGGTSGVVTADRFTYLS